MVLPSLKGLDNREMPVPSAEALGYFREDKTHPLALVLSPNPFALSILAGLKTSAP